VVAGVVPAALAALAPAGAGNVVALVGPAIGGCCYEVEESLASAVAARVPAAAATTTWGTPSLDLPAAVTAQLAAAGVARIERVGGCTRCGSDTWFSHRSATAGTAPAGRQGGIVVRCGPTSTAWPTSSLQSR
jgi:polyphenol oxidase